MALLWTHEKVTHFKCYKGDNALSKFLQFNLFTTVLFSAVVATTMLNFFSAYFIFIS